jgi:hypothetical protein
MKLLHLMFRPLFCVWLTALPVQTNSAGDLNIKIDAEMIGKIHLNHFINQLFFEVEYGLHIYPRLDSNTTKHALGKAYFAFIPVEELPELGKMLKNPVHISQFEEITESIIVGYLKETSLTARSMLHLASISVSDSRLLLRFPTSVPGFEFVDVYYTDEKLLSWLRKKSIK